MSLSRDLVSLQDLSKEEINEILTLTDSLKHKKSGSCELKGKSVALVFQKPSNRTRVSFEVGISQLGGNCIYLGPDEISLGVRESTADVSKTLSRYLDAIVARTHTHEDIVSLTKNSSVPVINGLSDLFHPCQGLTDLYSIKENFGTTDGLTVAYIGDGNNVCHSLLLGCAKIGINMNIATPNGYEPNITIMNLAESIAQMSGAKIMLTGDPKIAAENADVLYGDVWVSMGQEEESKKRLKNFSGFQINEELADLAKENYIFMHCLPAHRGQEVSEGVIDGPHSIVFDQAENRLHTQKAILIFLTNKG